MSWFWINECCHCLDASAANTNVCISLKDYFWPSITSSSMAHPKALISKRYLNDKTQTHKFKYTHLLISNLEINIKYWNIKSGSQSAQLAALNACYHQSQWYWAYYRLTSTRFFLIVAVWQATWPAYGSGSAVI